LPEILIEITLQFLKNSGCNTLFFFSISLFFTSPSSLLYFLFVFFFSVLSLTEPGGLSREVQVNLISYYLNIFLKNNLELLFLKANQAFYRLFVLSLDPPNLMDHA